MVSLNGWEGKEKDIKLKEKRIYIQMEFGVQVILWYIFLFCEFWKSNYLSETKKIDTMLTHRRYRTESYELFDI